MSTRPHPLRLPVLGLLGLLLLALLPLTQPVHGASLPAVRGTGGAVVSGHRLATEAGLEVLRAGGNAADAAVATALALAVVFPEAGNLGGGGFAVVKMGPEDAASEDGIVTSLDFRETAPFAAHRDMYLGEDGEPVREKSLIGPLATGTPGSPTGLWELHHRFGRIPWPQVVAPAIRLAAGGFVVDRHLHEVISADRELLARFPESAQMWLPAGEPPPVGAVLRLPTLAATLEAYAEHGPEAITEGAVAEAIEAASTAHGGVLTATDLAGYEAHWRPPVRFEAFGWQIASMDLPSSGGILLGEIFGVLERLGWGETPRFGTQRAHLLTEAFRRSYADRTLLGDPETTGATARELLAPAWLDHQARAIDPHHAADSRAVEPWGGEAPRVPPAPTPESTDTTHLSVVDGEGNLVALTTTLNGLFGCGLWVPEAGFFLNNEMDDFAAKPGRPNLYGLVQGEANAVRPDRRMLSSMSPTVAWRTVAGEESSEEGVEAVALGARGGSLIPTNTAQVLLNLVVDGDALQEAVNRPRIHHQWLPDVLVHEPDALAPEVVAALEALGHELETSDRTAKVHAVRRLPDGTVEAAREPRGQGAAGVVRTDRTLD
jgi:gamma-glutamyltranspeptidase/glutathione hydrolase